MPKEIEKPELFDIKGVEIFEAGTWNGDKYTVSDLDVLVAGFNETKDRLKPYLKLGHNEEQTLAQRDGMPAVGWIDGLRREGKKLVADFVRMPKKIYQLIKAGAYARNSCEIFFGFKLGDKVYDKLLKGVALLGGDTPAVNTLDDILAMYGAELFKVEAFNTEAVVKNYEIGRTNQMNELEQAKTALAELEKKYAEAIEALKAVETLKADIVKLTEEKDGLVKQLAEAKASVEKYEAQAKEADEAKKLSELNAKLDKLINDKKILPAQREALFVVLANADTSVEKKYKVGEKEISVADAVQLFIDNNNVNINTDAHSKAGERQTELSLADKATKYAEENKVSYKEALIAVSSPEKGK